MKKKICFIWIAAQACLFVTVFIVHAQTCVGGGVLSINSVPVLESFGSANVDVYDQELIHVFSDFVQFEDSRAVAQSFTLYVSVTDFDAISVENISIINW